jgi:hypothetical protein
VSTIVPKIAIAANTTMYSKIIVSFRQAPTTSTFLFFILKIFLQKILKKIKKLIPPIIVYKIKKVSLDEEFFKI